MPFNNPEFAGDGQLVLDQIQSRNFDASQLSQKGWRLSKDGTATLIGLDVRQINLRVGTFGTANFDIDKWVNGMAIAQNMTTNAMLASYITTTTFTNICDGTTFPSLSLLSPRGGLVFNGAIMVTVAINLDITAAAIPTALFDAKLVVNGSSTGQGLVVDYRDRAAGARETHTYVYEAVSIAYVDNAPQSTLNIQVRHASGVNPYTISTSNSLISIWGSIDMSNLIT